jgi:hypothetical protein
MQVPLLRTEVADKARPLFDDSGSQGIAYEAKGRPRSRALRVLSQLGHGIADILLTLPPLAAIPLPLEKTKTPLLRGF